MGKRAHAKKPALGAALRPVAASAPVRPSASPPKLVGRAVVLAHGAGGSSSHASMKMWRQQLASTCDEVVMVDFPRPYRMARLTATLADAVATAHEAGHGRVLIAGVGMGARVAAHLLSGTPDETSAGGDGDGDVTPLPASLAGVVVGIVALGYPLLRAGEVRDAALRAMREDAPPLLVACGSADAHVDVSVLEAARAASAAPRFEIHVVEGADQVLRAPEGTHLQRAATAALDAALESFVEQALGSAEQWSREVRVRAKGSKKARRAAAEDTEGQGTDARAARAAQLRAELSQLEEAQRRNREQQLFAKVLERKIRREAEEAAAERVAEQKRHAAERAAQHAAGAVAGVAAGAAADAAAGGDSDDDGGGGRDGGGGGGHPIAPPELSLVGCGCDEINGTYRLDGLRDGVASYRQVGGDFTIERDAAPGQATQWCLCVDYGFETLCYADSDGVVPPTSGWLVSDACEGPAPTLLIAGGGGAAAAAAAEAAAVGQARKTQGSKTLRRRKQMHSALGRAAGIRKIKKWKIK